MSSNQIFLLLILSLSDIPVVTTILYAIDNVSLSGMHNYWCQPCMLVPKTQSQNLVEAVALVDDFQQK